MVAYPYGNTVTADESGLQAPNIVRYTGGALDQTTGLIKFGQRYYDPAIGAFTQQDANQILANPSNGNLYAYAGDSPVNCIAPTGADWWGCAGAILGTAAAVGGLIAVSVETAGTADVFAAGALIAGAGT